MGLTEPDEAFDELDIDDENGNSSALMVNSLRFLANWFMFSSFVNGKCSTSVGFTSARFNGDSRGDSL